jgi:Txe/YoeB family toxin of Txe-Axe toxin-antitoxin module
VNYGVNVDESDHAQDEEEEQVIKVNTHIKEIRPNKYGGLTTLNEHLDEKNWPTWSRRIISILRVCKVYDYVNGTELKPNPATDPDSATNWETNDDYAKLLLLQNVTNAQLRHIDQEKTSTEVWKALISLHQARGFRTALTRMRTFYSTRATEDENIPDYINKMKTLVDDINNMKTIFWINDITYAGVLAQSLPATWDAFIDKLYPGVSDNKHSAAFSIVHFHRELKDEYYHRIGRKEDESLHTTQQSNLSVTRKTPLANRISGEKGLKLYCANCKKDNHTTDKCHHLGKALCTICNRFGHKTSDCYNNENCDRDNKRSAICAIIINWEKIPIITLQRKGNTNKPAKLLKQTMKRCLPFLSNKI